MSVLAADIIIYGAANMPEDDISLTGGAIDTATKLLFTDIAATDTVKLQSTNAGDTMNVTITGRDAAGAIVSEVKALNGVTLTTATTQTFERILKVVCASTPAGTVTITRTTGGTVIGTIEGALGITTIRRMFYNSSADASGGSTRNYYEKGFIKNTNSTNALLSATVAEQSDPTGKVTFDLEDAVNDNNSVANRLAAPTGMLGAFDGTTKSVPGTNLAAGAAIGVWLKLTLAAGDSAAKSTYTLRTAGSTT